MALLSEVTATAASVGSIAATWSGTTTTKNLIIVGIMANNGVGTTVSSIADTQSNTYTLVQRNNTSCNAELWYAWNIIGGAGTVTATLSNSTSAAIGMVIREYSQIEFTANPLDVSAIGNNAGSSTVATSATSNTIRSRELIVGVGGETTGTTWTPTGGFINSTTVTPAFGSMAVQSREGSGIAPYTSSWTLGGAVSWGSAVGTFKIIDGRRLSYGLRPRPFAPGLAR